MTAFEMPTAKTQSAAPVKPVDMAAIARAAAILEAGGLVAMPTETVYGLAADADQEAAVTATYRAKGRPLNHPLIVHVASADDIPWWAEITPEAQKLADRYWPGPLTMVLKKKPRCGSWVTGGQDTVALRCPSHPWAQPTAVRSTAVSRRLRPTRSAASARRQLSMYVKIWAKNPPASSI